MLAAGDERGRTQVGNNNAFCQDNETSWMSWKLDPEWQHLFDLCQTLLRLRSEHAVLSQPRASADHRDITWLQPTGQEMTEAAWHDPQATTLGAFLAGDPIGADVSTHAHRGTSLLLWWHAGAHPAHVTLPASLADYYLEVLRTDAPLTSEKLDPGSTVALLNRTFAVFAAFSG